MILYAVHYKGPITSNDWSIVTIHSTREAAIKHKNIYEKRTIENNIQDAEYQIIEIDTNNIDPIYDYSEW